MNDAEINALVEERREIKADIARKNKMMDILIEANEKNKSLEEKVRGLHEIIQSHVKIENEIQEDKDRLFALLQCIEWSRDQDVCPWCNYKSAAGHHEDCTVDLALKGDNNGQ